MKRAPMLRGLLVAFSTLLLTGCQSIVLGYANLNTAVADATAAYDPVQDLSLDIYLPPAGTLQPAPVIVFFYGGSWKTGSRGQYRFVGQRLAALGVVTVVADYRTYPRATFPGFVEDAAAAVSWAHRHIAGYGGDPSRLFVAGHSAGAQIAALIGTDGRYLAAHGMKPTDLAGVIGLSGPYDFAIGPAFRPVFGPPSQWPQAQAINFVNGDEPRFLLIHGLDDRVVEAADSQQLADRLRSAGGQAHLVWLPGAGHAAPLAALYQPARNPSVLEAIGGFVQK